jgi:hypothetical protein
MKNEEERISLSKKENYTNSVRTKIENQVKGLFAL